MNLPNQLQVNAAGRHILSYAMGAVSALAAIHVISAGDAATLTSSFSKISTGVSEIAAGMAPIIALVSTWYAAWAQSHTAHIAAVNAVPGLKVVAEDGPGVEVTVPPKGPLK